MDKREWLVVMKPEKKMVGVLRPVVSVIDAKSKAQAVREFIWVVRSMAGYLKPTARLFERNVLIVI